MQDADNLCADVYTHNYILHTFFHLTYCFDDISDKSLQKTKDYLRWNVEMAFGYTRFLTYKFYRRKMDGLTGGFVIVFLSMLQTYMLAISLKDFFFIIFHCIPLVSLKLRLFSCFNNDDYDKDAWLSKGDHTKSLCSVSLWIFGKISTHYTKL